jgi:hypothetical protein
MTTQETMHLIGQLGTIQTGGLTVQIRILNVKVSYGRTRYQVQPIAGEGSVWIEQVKLNNNENKA